MIPVLLIMVLLPIAGLLSIVGSRKGAGNITLGVAVLELLLFIYAVYTLSHSGPFNESYPFIPKLGINFEFSLNNLNFVFVFLSVIVFTAASTTSEFFTKEEHVGYYSLFMLAESGVLGMFLSGNLIILYLFWDLSIISLFFMLFHFGGYDRRYASIKFIIYSLLSSSLLLIGIIMTYFYLPVHSFEISQLMSSGYLIQKPFQTIIFILLLLAFIIKMPAFPLHAWAPDAYSESTPEGAMLLAGVLSKFGVYGLLLLFISMPIAKEYSFYVATLFAFSSIYASAVALVQKNLKRMLSYLSISEIGIIGFAITTSNIIGLSGALFGSLSHALIISLLFLLTFSIGKVFGTTILQRLSGILNGYRVLGYSFLFAMLATLGLPLTTGFITDILTLIGGARSFGLLILAPALAIIINASYLFWIYEKSFLTGESSELFEALDKNVYIAILLLITLIIALGVFPSIILNYIGVAV
ncbi:MAG: NADH-quinone oxidoreductase subunit M [Candidatus Micrarchaeota archaeon]